MAISMIRGYGLPNDAASSYNGYRGYGAVASRQPAHPAALFRTLPDPELGGYGEYDGFGISLPGAQPVRAISSGVVASNPTGIGGGTTAGTTPSAGGFNFLGPSIAGIPVVFIGAGLLGLYFFMRK